MIAPVLPLDHGFFVRLALAIVDSDGALDPLLPRLVVHVPPVGAGARDLEAAHQVVLQRLRRLVLRRRRRAEETAARGDDPLRGDARVGPADVALVVAVGLPAFVAPLAEDLEPHVVVLLLHVGAPEDLRLLHALCAVFQVVGVVTVHHPADRVEEHP